MPYSFPLLRRCLLVMLIVCVTLSSKSIAQDWALKSKPKGTLKVVDLYLPEVSVRTNYCEGLVGVDKNNKLIACLAEDWRWIDDRTVEFKLREGVRFHNGERFDADSVRINWEAYRKMNSPLGKYIQIDDRTLYEKTDQYKVQFILPQPNGMALPAFVWFTQFAPKFFQTNKFEEGNWGYLPTAGPWGTGPFKLMEGNVRFAGFASRFVLEANEDYWDRRYPKVKRLVFDGSFIGNREEAMRLCQESEGNVDIVNTIRPLDTLKVAASPFAKVVKSKDVTDLVGFINERKARSKWRDVRLRMALNYAINREELRKYAAKGNAYDLGCSIPVGAYGHNPDLPLYSYDIAHAKSLIEAAGYPGGFELTIITFESWKLETQIIKSMLERIGLRVNVKVMNHPELLRKIFAPALDAPPESQSWDIAILHRWDWAGHTGISFSGWALLHDSLYRWIEFDPVYEDMWEDMAKTVDVGEQERKIKQLERYVYERAHFLYIYSPVMLYAVNKDVNFVPYEWEWKVLKETSVTDRHWSIRVKND